MSKKERFLMLVQTAVIIESIKGEPSTDTHSGRATQALFAAMRVDENHLPDDVEAACDMFVDSFFYPDKPKPDWFVTVTAGS